MKSSVTISTVAKAAEVSIQPVSRVVHNRYENSPETGQRVLQAPGDPGYRANNSARDLGISRAFTPGLVMLEITHPSGCFHAHIASAEAFPGSIAFSALYS